MGKVAGQNLYQKALTVVPQSADANYNLGLIALSKGNNLPMLSLLVNRQELPVTWMLLLEQAILLPGGTSKPANAMAGVNTNNSCAAFSVGSDHSSPPARWLRWLYNAIAAAAYLWRHPSEPAQRPRRRVQHSLKTAVPERRIRWPKALGDLEFTTYFTDTQLDSSWIHPCK